MIYNKYSDYLKEKYGEKVYKLPIKVAGTCPNRDGTCGSGGCAFCGEEGGSFENLSEELSIKEQFKKNREYIQKRYNANKFIAYFQNYSNSYMSLSKFKEMINSVLDFDIVGIYISTRPDCISEEQLKFLADVKKNYKLEILLELGLQTSNYRTLIDLNRGHTLAEFIYASNLIKSYGLKICTHVIIGLPGDEMVDAIETSKLISALAIDQVKLHALYILKKTEYGKRYESGKIDVISKEDYISRVISFLRYLDPKIVVQRLIGRSPKEDSLFSNWSCSWWLVQEEIEKIMTENGYKQGDLFYYLGSKYNK